MRIFYDFKNKLFLSYSVFFLLITVIALVAFYSYTSSSMQNSSRDLLAQTSEKITYKLDNIVSSMNTVSLQVISNQGLQSILPGLSEYNESGNFFDYYHKQEVTDILTSINSPLINNARISIFDTNQNFLSVGYLDTKQDAFINNFSKYDVLTEFNSSDKQMLIFAPHKDNWTNLNPQIVFSLLRKLPYIYGTNQVVGYVEIEQPYSFLEDAVSIATNHSIEVVITDQDQNIVYPYDQLNSSQTDYYNLLASASPERSIRPWDEQEDFVFTQTSETSGWTVILTQSKNDYLNTLLTFRNLLLSYGIIFFLVVLFLLFWVTKKLTSPIAQLRKSVESLSISEPSVLTNTDHANSEIVMLTDAFNQTIKRLNESMEQTLAANVEQVQAHILAMQSQMNPHFLFNTLMGISGIAEESDDIKVVQICEKLASMLRYISSFKDSRVLLKEEINYTKAYLELMKIRYEDFLQYNLHIDDNVLSVSIAKLILQPIVENCFSHGFKNITPPYKIDIAILTSLSHITISVSDNGEGFSEEALNNFYTKLTLYQSMENIADYIKNSEIGGLGLTNIFLRLFLIYGTDMNMDIQNNTLGCTVFIRIPLNFERKKV